MKKKFALFMLILLLVGIFVINLEIAPVALGGQGDASDRKEVWQLVNVTNPGPTNKSTNIEISVSPSREGVNIACSTDITKYFENPDPGYTDWLDWLNGTTKSPYHWGEMDWYVSAGSLTGITYDQIQQWWDMYSDSGASVTYETFMDNTYMADWNSAVTYNDPDIIYPPIAWQENKFVIEYLPVFNGTTINFAFKIVITEPGAYTFNVTSTTTGLTISPSSWTVGGISTLLVPHDYSTIQGAIDNARPSDIIIVDEGTYVEDLGIPATKPNLEIRPEADASVAIKGVQNVPIASFPLAIPNVEINASGVKIHGFTIEGPDYASGRYSSGVVIGAPNVEIYNNTFKVTPAATLDEISQAIQTYHKNAIPGVDVSGLSIHDNKFTNLSVGEAGYEGIYINLDEGINAVTVHGNQFSGSIVRAITTERSETTISGNTITTDLAPNLPGGYQGINVGGVNPSSASNVLVTGNTINGSDGGKGFLYGIKLGYSGTSTFTNVSIIGNTIQMNDVGVWVKFSASGVKVSCNNIVGNSIYGVKNTDTEAINAAYNWWGDDKGPGNETGSTGDYVTDNVNYGPWLIEPYAPGQVVPVSVVYVDPPYIIRTTPAIGTTFTVNVSVANVSMLYAFQFDLKWNSSLLNLANYVNYTIPNWTNYRVMKNNVTAPGDYSLAVTALSPSSPFNGSTTLASFTFEIIYDPVYPENVGCSLALENVTIADSDAEPILRLAYGGNYSCYSTRTKLVLMPQDFMAYKVPTEFDVYVNVINVADLYAFKFELTYNTALLEVIVDTGVDIVIPCYSESITLSSGRVFVRVEDIDPSARNGTRALVRIPFKVKGFVWNTTKTSANCTLAFSSHELNSTILEEIQHDVVNGTYRYTPIPGDLNMDGTVDIFDIILAARAFGSEPPSDPRADLNCDGKVDILDIVKIAVNFGREEP